MNNKTTFTKQDEIILNEWKLTRDLRPSTWIRYLYAVRDYTEATGMTITELYEEAIREEEQHVPTYRKSIKRHFMEFKEYLNNETKLTENTRNHRIRAMRSFYISHDITIPNISYNYDTTPDPDNVGKMISENIIKIMIEAAGVRDKLVLSFALLTGQSPNEIAHLRIKDFVDTWNTMLSEPIFSLPDIFKYKQEILSLECPSMKIHRGKTNTNYWVYIPSEISRYCIDYLYERVAGRNEKIRVHSLDDPLILTKAGKAFSAHSITTLFNNIARQAGLTKPELFDKETRLLLQHSYGKHHIWTAYHYRKYFLNMCRRFAGTRPDSKGKYVFSGQELGDFWIGHKQRGSISHYLQYNDEDVCALREHYLQVYPYLSVEHTVDVMTSEDKKEFDMMKEKYEEMQQELKDIKEYIRYKKKLGELAKIYELEDV